MQKGWTNITLSDRTHKAIEKLQRLVERERATGLGVSKHEAVAQAVAEAIARRTADKREGKASSGGL